MRDAVDDVRRRLEAIAEELADLALDRLREAGSDPAAAGEERRLTRARRAVERAAAALGGSGGPAGDH